MLRRAFRVVPLVALATVVTCGSVAAVPRGPTFGSVVASGPDEVRLHFVLPPFELREQAPGIKEIVIDGLPGQTPPGSPRLPIWSRMVAVPPGSNPRIVVHDVASRSAAGVRLASVPVSETLIDGIEAPYAEGAPARRVATEQPDMRIFGRDTLYPDAPVVMAGRGTIRDLDFARIEVHPFRYNPVTGELAVITSLDFSIVFGGNDGASGRDVKRSRRPVNCGRPDALPASSSSGAASALTPPGSGFLNPEMIPQFRLRRPSPPGLGETSISGVPAGTPEAAKIDVSKDGMYAFTGQDLITAGVTLAGRDPNYFRMYYQGKEIAILVDGERGRRFGAADRITFYGVKNRARWTDTNVYWLVLDDIGLGAGKRMEKVDFHPADPGALTAVTRAQASIRIEEQGQFFIRDPDVNASDSWYYAKRLWTCSVCDEEKWTLEIPFTFSPGSKTLAGETYRISGRLTAGAFGSNMDPNNLIRLYLNGTRVGGDITWTVSGEHGPNDAKFSFTFAPDVLVEGANILKVEQPLTTSSKQRFVYVDYFDIEYPDVIAARGDTAVFRGSRNGGVLYSVGSFTTPDLHAFFISTPEAPRSIEFFYRAGLGPGLPVTALVPVETSAGESETLLVQSRQAAFRPDRVYRDTPSFLRDTVNAADFVLITPADFATEVTRLADYRRTKDADLTTSVVDIVDIYDEFSAGNVDPRAIRDFVEWSLFNWTTAPTFVLLVGDSSYDYKNNLAYSGAGYEKTFFIPSNSYYMVDPVMERTASDALFAQVAGDDMLPDVLIGRFPVRSAAQVSAIVDKIVQHESMSGNDPWSARYVLLADDDMPNRQRPEDCAPNGLADRDFEDLIVTPFLSRLPPESTIRIYADDDKYSDESGVRADIQAELGQGAAAFVYIGHGATTLMGRHCNSPSGLGFVHESDAPLFTNVDRCPIGVTYTCNTGNFEWVSWFGDRSWFQWECVTEKMTFSPGNGMVAWIASTSEGSNVTGRVSVRQVEGFFRALFDSNNLPPFLADAPPALVANKTAGALQFAAQSWMYEVSGDAAQDTIDILVLLGDPMTQLRARTQ